MILRPDEAVLGVVQVGAYAWMLTTERLIARLVPPEGAGAANNLRRRRRRAARQLLSST